MPELPEVETTRAGLKPYCINRQIKHIESRIDKLRQPIDQKSFHSTNDRFITDIHRRGKYLIFQTDNINKSILIHLGMSGSLRIVPSDSEYKVHDHISICLDNSHEIRLHDPRKFGHFEIINPNEPHRLLDHIGVEPLEDTFNPEYLYKSTRKRRSAIKNHIMNQEIVVGVGNIYATEALFLSHIRPDRPAGEISVKEADKLVKAIKEELSRAIHLGGTTLRDFVKPDGTNGYFQQTLKVYGNMNKPCSNCQSAIENIVIGGRASAYCPKCQH